MSNTVSPKEKILRKLQAYRDDGIDYKPDQAASSYIGLKESPILYYKVFDNSLRPTSDITYAHSLDELFYMAIDNSDRLSTLDNLVAIRPSFSPRTMTVADLILTAFIGTKDGQLTSLFAAPYQGQSPYSLDTTLYAIAMSEMIPNSKGQPLRIALNVPTTMKKWSHLSRLSFLGSRASNSTLIELNTRVNNGQILELRNDPEGCVRYSAKARALLAQREKEKGKITSSVAPVVPMESAEGAPATEPSPTEDVPPESAVESPTTAMPANNDTVETQQAPKLDRELGAAIADEPVQSTTTTSPPPLVQRKSALDVSAITGPLQAAKLADKTHYVPDKTTIEANESHPALEHIKTAPESPAPQLEVATEGEGMFSNTKALLEANGTTESTK